MTPSVPRSSKSWWASGLPFSCTQCGKCCEVRGDVQWIFVPVKEQRRLAQHLELSLKHFRARYMTRTEENIASLRMDQGKCVFLLEGRCSVHQVKPTQCRTWPFWPENLASPEAWKLEVESICPGSHAAPVVPAKEIARQAEEAAEAERMLS